MQVAYDILVMAVGETTATFGVPGVSEHCFFMKARGLHPSSSAAQPLSALPPHAATVSRTHEALFPLHALHAGLPRLQGLSQPKTSACSGEKQQHVHLGSN